jgi:hypothetical protein
LGWSRELDPRRFDNETRRKPLAFAADAVSYGIGTPVGRQVESWRYVANVVDGKMGFQGAVLRCRAMVQFYGRKGCGE